MSDPSVNEIRTLAHTFALKELVEHLLEEQFRATGDPDDASRRLLAYTEGLTKLPLGLGAQASAATNELFCQELRDTMVRHVLRGRAAALGVEFDPADIKKDWSVG